MRMQDAGRKSLSCIVNRVSCIGSYYTSRVTHHALRNERGIALVMVLVLSAIMLAIIAALVYMLTSGTQVSGIQKRYRTALEAGQGGSDAMYELIAARSDPGITGICTLTFSATCLTDKLTKATSSWSSACDNLLTITPVTAPATYDMYCTLGNYTAYAKIVDTVPGNSGADLGLRCGGVVSDCGGATTPSIPALYTIEVDAENSSNPAERAKLSVLYQY